MYTIQTMNCTGPTNMNHVPLPPPSEPVASEFYKHPYGGIARDISVSREGFMRFFQLDEQEMLIAESFAGHGKVFDTFANEHEYFGYINLFPGGRLSYIIVIIDRSRDGAFKHLRRVIEKTNLQFVEFSHKSDPLIKVKIPAKEISEWN